MNFKAATHQPKLSEKKIWSRKYLQIYINTQKCAAIDDKTLVELFLRFEITLNI